MPKSICLSIILTAIMLLTACASTLPQPNPIHCKNTTLEQKHKSALTQLSHQPNGFGVWLNSPKSTLTIGDWLSLNWQTQQDAYINLFYISSSDHSAQLISNQKQLKHQPTVYPNPQQNSGLRLKPPIGIENYLIFASHEPLALINSRAVIQQRIQTFDLTGEKLLATLQTFTDKLAPNAWASSYLQIPLCYPLP